MLAPPLAPGCPWSAFQPPTMRFCEANLCSWIAAPADTWSNLGFVFAGLYLIFRARRDGARASRWIGPTAVAVGLASFAYHASYTFVLQVADRASMVLFISLLVALNLKRLGWPRDRVVATYLALNVGSLALDLGFHRIFPEIDLIAFGSQVALVLALEWRLKARRPALEAAPPYRCLARAGAAFAVGWGFWWLDVTRVWCDPNNHLLQGHALWHLANAAAFLFVYRFYRALEGPAASARAGAA